MPRCWFVLLCACHSAGTVATVPPPSESGGDAPEEPSVLVDGLSDILYQADDLVDRERYEASRRQREAYGDGEGCEGVCGLSVPEVPEPEPVRPEDLSFSADTLERMALAAQELAGAHWTVLASRLGELASHSRVEGDPNERMSEMVLGALQALDAITATENAASADLCVIGMYVVAADLSALRKALLDAANELELQIQIDYGMEPGDTSGAEQQAEELAALFEQTDPLTDRVAAGLTAGPAQVSALMPDLENLASLVEPVLGARILERVRGSSSRLRLICPAP